MGQNIGEMADRLKDTDLREYLDQDSNLGTEADEATHLITDAGVGGYPSQQKPPIMSLDCWNRCYWFFEMWLKTGRVR